MTYKPADG